MPEVPAESLFEAAARGVAALKRCSSPVEVKSPMELLVRVRAPETRHFLQCGKVEAWLASSGAPREQALEAEGDTPGVASIVRRSPVGAV